ncbi:MAG TPA: cytochrome d ubiquinol oxidase subunit II [Bacteroidales bacterium]|nr:cytochrome d ubiquinol oxidase subunit II [Bacteroidales bacterium]
MFESCSYLFLQYYWWIIVSLLAAFFIFLTFVQGGQTLFGALSKNEIEKTMLVNSTGRKWEFTFTTLVVFGGAMFAAFPKFYATSFGGAYWVWIAILFCFIIQAVSYEFRKKRGNFLGSKVYESFLYINGSVGVFLIGVAVGTFFTGSDFRINEMNQVLWLNHTRGLEAVFNIQNVALGLAVFSLARVLGSLYFINNIDDEEIYKRSKMQLIYNTVIFLVFFLTFIIMLFIKDGFAYDTTSGTVTMEPYKYLNNLLQMPTVLIIFVAGVLLVLTGIGITIFMKSRRGIWFSGIGTVMTVFALMLIAGFNNTCFYPSSADLQSSLTIENSSSSKYTLMVMSYVSLILPFVIAYIFFAWKAIDRKKIDRQELSDTEHKY